jgi:ParB family chromosome partitioning protein
MRNKHLTALHSSKSNEWYTPSRYIEAARDVLGSIDLDPASCATANEIVQATKYFTDADDGLHQSWRIDGRPTRTWLNPPYGYIDGKKSSAGTWTARMIDAYERNEIEAGILLVTSVVEKKWFQPLWNYPLCVTDHRIKFYNEQFPRGSQPAQGSTFVYFGMHEQRFIDVFSAFGPVVKRVSPSSHKSTVNPHLSLWSTMYA